MGAGERKTKCVLVQFLSCFSKKVQTNSKFSLLGVVFNGGMHSNMQQVEVERTLVADSTRTGKQVVGELGDGTPGGKQRDLQKTEAPADR